MLNKKEITYNTLISAGARVIGLILSLVSIGLISRYLGQAGFGYYATVLAFLYFFSMVADLGLYSITLREISRHQADEKKIAGNAFTLRFFAGLIIFAAAPLIVLFFPYPNQVKLGVLIAAFGFWLLSNQQVLIGVFQKYLRMDKVALAELTGRLIQLSLIVFFIWQGFGFLFIVGALVGGALVNFLFVFIFIQKYVPISFKFNFPYWRFLLKESLPLGLAIVFIMIYFKIDTIMLSLIKPAEDVGIYNLAYKFLESLFFFPAMFVGLMMPLLSKYALSMRNKFNEVAQNTMKILLIFAVPLVIGTILLSEKIVVLIAGEAFILSAGVLNILIVAAGVIFLGYLFSNMIVSLKKQKTLTYIYGIGAAVNLATNFIFIPKYSYYGAAGTTLLTELLVTVLMVVVLYKNIKKIPSFRPLLKYLSAGAAMAALLYLLPDWPLFTLVFLGALVYFTVLYLMREFSIEEILLLIKKSD